MTLLTNIIEIILGLLALLGIIFTAWKILRPQVRFELVSFYYTFDDRHHMMCLLKLNSEASTNIVIEKIISVTAYQGDDPSLFLRRRVRWKAFIPVMRDALGESSIYRLLKPMEPDIVGSLITSTNKDFYLELFSECEFKDLPINKWEIEFECRSSLFFMPRWLSRRTITVSFAHPNSDYLYYDDSLIEKITEEKRDEIIKNL